MIDLNDDSYLKSIFGPIEISIRHWRSMALNLGFQSSLKEARIEDLKKYVALCLMADQKVGGPLVGDFQFFTKKQLLSIGLFEFLFDYKMKTLKYRLQASSLFNNQLVEIVLATNQSTEIKLCCLIDRSNCDIDSMTNWLMGLAREFDNLIEFKKDLKWFNSHKKLEVASRAFNVKLGAPHVTKEDIEAYLFGPYTAKSDKERLISNIKANYRSLMHREKSGKKQLNVYIDLEVFDNIEEIFSENKMSASELVSFLFAPKNKEKINNLIKQIKLQ